MFKKEKGICCICNTNEGNKKIREGMICNECISQCGTYRPLSWKELSIQQVKTRIAQNIENSKRNSIFCSTQKVEKYFDLDENNKLWKVSQSSLIFTFDEIINFELLENGNSIIKGGLGTSIIGGAMFGDIGAIVGSNVGKKKAVQEITEFRIKIITKNSTFPQVYINFLETGKVKANGLIFRGYTASAQKILSLLAIITSDKENSKAASSSVADEILKFKNLLDEGIITQEEFDKKKVQLLNL